jgi:hypothetical protein
VTMGRLIPAGTEEPMSARPSAGDIE